MFARTLLSAAVFLGATVAAQDAERHRHEQLLAEHWAFQPIASPPPPEGLPEWSTHPIDRFVAERWKAAGLSPSRQADRATLLRRVHFDLLGLPPTFEEVRAFAADSSPDALTKVIAALLERREYGERWGRQWLDVARYADAKGYVDAGEPRYPFAYTYRDYVIRAFNEDLPFDRFVMEQLAADHLVDANEPAADTWPLAALGFLTVGSRFNFFPHDVLDDRIDVITRGLMGLTVSCARCHDHKYDPIGTDEYYGLYGVLASSIEPPPDELPILSPPRADRTVAKELAKKLAPKADAYKKRRAELHAQIMHEMRAWAKDYLVYLVQLMPEHRTQAQPPLRTKRGLLREVTAYGRGGVGRWRRFIAARGPDDPVFGFWNRMVRLAREDIAKMASRELAALKRLGKLNPLVEAAFTAQPPRTMVDVASAYGELLEATERLWAAGQKSAPRPSFDDPAREALREVLYGADAPATMTVDESEDLYHLNDHTDVRKRFAEIERVFLAAKSPRPRGMVVLDRPSPYEPRVFVRGNPERLGKVVPRRAPRILAAVRDAPFSRAGGSGRLELARTIVDRRNPLTARVIVNRVWGWHFGQPLVATPSDFGVRSARPTQVALLDFLATWLMESGWSLKKLHRFILLSKTWQQASRDRPECREVDAGNELFWRANRRRLDFESMRDAILKVSGRLTSRNGGKPVRVSPDDPSFTGRTVYCFVDRERLAPVFRVFDFPSPDIHSAMRPKTTVPQQALFLLNSQFVGAAAEALVAASAQPEDSSREARLRSLYRRVYARDPDAREIQMGLRFLAARSSESARADFRGPESAPAGGPWVEYARVLLVSSEFLFVD